MKLDAVTHGENALIYMERYVNEGTKTYSPFAARNEAAARYRPESAQVPFNLVTLLASKDCVSVVEAAPDERLRDFFLRGECVLFAVHPETWDSEEVQQLVELHPFAGGAPIRVAPTASTRTVFAIERESDLPAHFIKLHFPRRISRFMRTLKRLNIQNSVEITRDLAELHFDKFAYLPDVLGIAFGEGRSAWGFLIREGAPRPFEPDRFLIPCFALYGADREHPEDPPLLVQLIEHLDAEPQSFVVNEIMLPLVECWVKVVRERGLLLESHAQNTLLELDRDFHPRRIVHRDLDLWIDRRTRRSAHLESPFLGADITAGAADPIGSHYSLIYDRFIGHEFFDYLLNVLKRFYGIEGGAVREQVKDAFHRFFPDADHFFPAQTMFYFSNATQPGKEFILEDMKQPPEWR